MSPVPQGPRRRGPLAATGGLHELSSTVDRYRHDGDIVVVVAAQDVEAAAAGDEDQPRRTVAGEERRGQIRLRDLISLGDRVCVMPAAAVDDVDPGPRR